MTSKLTPDEEFIARALANRFSGTGEAGRARE